MTTTARRRTTKKAEKPLRSSVNVRTLLTKFLSAKHEVTQHTSEQNRLKKEISQIVEERSYQDDKGSYFLDLEAPVGSPNGQTVSQIKYEARTSQWINEERALALLHKKSLVDRAVKLVPTLDQDELYVLNQEGLITDKEIDSLLESSTTYAFKPITD